MAQIAKDARSTPKTPSNSPLGIKGEGFAMVSISYESFHVLVRRTLIAFHTQRHRLVETGDGDAPGTRTPNLVIKSHLLCQLS